MKAKERYERGMRLQNRIFFLSRYASDRKTNQNVGTNLFSYTFDLLSVTIIHLVFT